MTPFLLFVVLFAMFGLSLVLITRGKESSRLTVRDGRRLLAAGDHERAADVFTYLRRKQHPRRVREAASYWLGHALMALGREEEAQGLYLQYLREFTEGADPTRLAQVKRLVGATLLELRQRPSMTPWAEFKEQRGLEPEVKLLGLDDGVRLLEAGEARKALVVLKPAIDYRADAPGRERALLYLGVAYEALHSPELASEVYRRYLAQHVGVPEVSHDPAVRVLIEARLRNLEQDAERAARIPWEVLEEELTGIRERLGEGSAAPERERVRLRKPEAEGPEIVSPALVRADLGLLDVGRKLGPYVLAEKLGEGGFGEVYRGLRPVAIKFARDAKAAERLERLARLQTEVASRRVVRPLEVQLGTDPPYVVMEFVEGADLRGLLEAGRLTQEQALAVSHEIALGLRDAHAAGVWHLDLKPENVLLDPAGIVKLTDFELGRTERSEELQQSLALSREVAGGTLAYMSPEQRAGKQVDARSDVFTFGLILFEALTGMLPEPGDKPSQFVEGLPQQIDAIFERCFTRSERRYADATELVADLERAAPERVDLRELFAGRVRKPEPESEESTAEDAEDAERVESTRTQSELQLEPEPEVDRTQQSDVSGQPRPSLDSLLAAQRAEPAPGADLDTDKLLEGEG